MSARWTTLLLLTLLVWSRCQAAETVIDLAPGETIVLTRAPASTPVQIDGRTDEAIWQSLPAYDEFVVIEPDTLAKTSHGTQIRLFYNDKGLYVGARMFQPRETLIRRLSGRDQPGLNRDSINLNLDTSGEGRYGFWFGVNLGGSLSDGTVVAERQFNNEWDGAWRGASAETADGWSAEFFIPWGTLAMPRVEGKRRLGLYMSRKVAYRDERWGWPALPPTVAKFLSAFNPLQLEGINPKRQFSLFPYASAASDRVEHEDQYKTGLDFFWRPSSNLQLAGTLNPDFGTVESDDVVVNLSATETFFSDKRLFFLEGQDVFITSPRADTRGVGLASSNVPYTMLNTRRIGDKARAPVLPPGTTISTRELTRPVDLMGAMKLTGQSGRLRYGLLGAFEEDQRLAVRQTSPLTGRTTNATLEQKGSDYGALRLIYEDNSAGYRALGVLATAVLHEAGDAMVQGLDAHLRSPDGKLKLDGQFMSSDVDSKERGYGGFVDLDYTFRRGVVQRVGIEYFDEDIELNDLGYLQRRDNFRIRTAHQRTVSNIAWARDNLLDLRAFAQRNGAGYFTGGGLMASDRITFHNLSELTLRANLYPASYDDLNSFGNGTFRTHAKRELTFDYKSNSTHALGFNAGMSFSEEALGGDHYSFDLGMNWRPTGQFALDLQLNYHDRDDWLLHQGGLRFTGFDAEQWSPKLNLDYFLTAKHHLRTSLQWIGVRATESEFYQLPRNSTELVETARPPGAEGAFGISQLSFQLRYRWEIAPLSDLFVVYTRLADTRFALAEDRFTDLFDHAWQHPVGDLFIVKLRYRLGS